MRPLRSSIWSHDSNETASRKPGALHSFPPPALPGFLGTTASPPPHRARPIPRGRPVARPRARDGLPVLRALSLCTCCRHYPGAAGGFKRRSDSPAHISLPRIVGRVGLHIDLSRFAQRSLTLRPAHSHGHLCDRHPGASDTSSPPCLPRLLPAGAVCRVGPSPTGKAPPLHGAHQTRPFSGPVDKPRYRRLIDTK